MEEADGGEGGGRFTPEIRRKESTSTGDPRSQGKEGRMISPALHTDVAGGTSENLFYGRVCG